MLVSPRARESGFLVIICIVFSDPSYNNQHRLARGKRKERNTGTNVAKDVTDQPTRESGISNARKIRAYFLVPELTTPQRN
jgi:hypothetical protein